jgi:hypothetical protein
MSGENLTYPDGQCTRYVADNWSEPVGPYWGDGREWLGSASAAGWDIVAGTTGGEAGDIAVWGPNVGGAGSAGHVALVVQAAPLTVDESNWTYPLRYDRRVVDAASQAGIIGYVRPVMTAAVEDETVAYLLSGAAATPADLLARRIKVHEWAHASGAAITPAELSESVMDEVLAVWVESGAEAALARMLGA